MPTQLTKRDCGIENGNIWPFFVSNFEFYLFFFTLFLARPLAFDFFILAIYYGLGTRCEFHPFESAILWSGTASGREMLRPTLPIYHSQMCLNLQNRREWHAIASTKQITTIASRTYDACVCAGASALEPLFELYATQEQTNVEWESEWYGWCGVVRACGPWCSGVKWTPNSVVCLLA